MSGSINEVVRPLPSLCYRSADRTAIQMKLEAEVSAHYSKSGLYQKILEALDDIGISPTSATANDLKLVDEFHVGGISATTALIDQLALKADMKVLDIGSGIGGTARFVAGETEAHVTGVDLTPEYTSTAIALSKLVGMGDATDFQTASALNLPFDNDSFDAALMFHVGMNIRDKPALMREAARVLRPNGLFAIYDIMKVGDEPISFPVPWASVRKSSFLVDLQTYREAATRAGFAEVSSRDKTTTALEFFAAQERRSKANGLPVIGLHILMGADFPKKLANMVSNISSRRIAPTELILRLK
ncbi:methyltransferase domain-containing protein [Pontixanthobacter aestiaquae]|uniref:Methyltransferase domain-containing protein n=1 Tax=Pontixanthobacter aestiaquae TaxID=1509367 RepID=A0A844Z4R2_9SPHN|nr:class I SAM-dependent methyltransferase [Pontixanthobacter aestiaquae]MDN3646751.1 methyltransferase domain-containing protein [Pontixanthobacter aestiaquae]MXO82266.1 methyltransferase domain-containing protein [Pontixanthobacter aestiaquae]